jgi:hypothetical protein
MKVEKVLKVVKAKIAGKIREFVIQMFAALNLDHRFVHSYKFVIR